MQALQVLIDGFIQKQLAHPWLTALLHTNTNEATQQRSQPHGTCVYAACVRGTRRVGVAAYLL
jgi:hypothetical protein